MFKAMLMRLRPAFGALPARFESMSDAIFIWLGPLLKTLASRLQSVSSAALSRLGPSALKGIQLRDFTYVGVSMLGRVINIAYMLVAVSKIGSRDFGVFSFVQVSALTIATLFAMAMTTSLNVILARNQASNVGARAASFCIFYLMACSFIFLLIFIIPKEFIHGVSATFPIKLALFLYSVSLLSQNLFQGWLFGAQKTTYVAYVTLGTSLISLAAIILAPRGHAVTLLVAYGIGMTLSAILMGFRVYRSSAVAVPSMNDARGFAREYGKTMLSFGSKSILNSTIFQVGLWQLQAHIIATMGPVESAHYALGVQFFNIVVFVPVLIAPILLNRLGKMSVGSAQAARFALKVTLLFAVLAGCEFASILVAFPLLPHILPKAYSESLPAIFWAISAGTLLFVRTPLSVYFQSALRAFPETISVTFSALLLISIPLFIARTDAAQAAQIRLICSLQQLLTIAGFFLVSRLEFIPKRFGGARG